MLFIFRSLFVFLLVAGCVHAKKVNVLFVPPGEVRYWKDVTVPMTAAAETLNLNLIIKPVGNTEEEDYEKQVLMLINTTPDIDWLIWSQRRIATQKILEALEKRKIKSLDITSGLFKDVREKTGHPQQKYKHWMAQVVTDEYKGGHYLANELIGLRRAAEPSSEIKLVGLAGNKRVAATAVNVSALRDTAKADKDASVLQVVHISWSMEDAKRMTQQLFLRYKNIDAIWASNTSIALGAIAQLNDMTFEQQARPLVANLGWSEGTFEAIKKGQLEFSLGGNHLNGLWALIVIHDIEHGISLPATPEHTIIKAPYTKVTKENVALVEPYFSGFAWQHADIKQYSKVYNPKLTHYNFDLSLLLTPPKVKQQ